MKKIAKIILKFIVVSCVLIGLMCMGAEPIDEIQIGKIQIIGVALVAIGFFLGWCFKPIIEEDDEEIYDNDLF